MMACYRLKATWWYNTDCILHVHGDIRQLIYRMVVSQRWYPTRITCKRGYLTKRRTEKRTGSGTPKFSSSSLLETLSSKSVSADFLDKAVG